MKQRNLLLIVLIFVWIPNAAAEIIFETDFSNDGDYYDTGTSFIRFTNLPEGFDGIRTNDGIISGAPGQGMGGSVALKIEYPAIGTALATSLFKHLTGEKGTGYEEVYVRYRLKLPGGFRAGRDGKPLPYWKWGRLWQNAGLNGDGWTEQRRDSYYVVWAWGSGLPKWGIRNELTFGENLNTDNTGSAGGPRSGTNWYSGYGSGCGDLAEACKGHHVGLYGYWDNVGNGAWEFNHDTRNLYKKDSQDWHTFEWRFKLSTTDTSNDGVFQLWFDGVEQIHPNKMGSDQSVDRPHTNNSLVTAAKPGFNLFTLFDNMAEWGRDWDQAGVDPFILINDVVISTTRIGHDYHVGMAPPRPPTHLEVN